MLLSIHFWAAHDWSLSYAVKALSYGHADVYMYSGTGGLYFGLGLYLHQYFVYFL